MTASPPEPADPAGVADQLAGAILRLLAERRPGATICPSDAARAVSTQWRPLMEPARQAARRLVAAGQVVVTQRGQVVDPASARGPIRIGRVADWPSAPASPHPWNPVEDECSP